MATITCFLDDNALLDQVLSQARYFASRGGDQTYGQGMVVGRLTLIENLFYGYDACKLHAVKNEVNFLFNKEAA